MCSEMSQYIPITAIISEMPETASGMAAQPGRPERRASAPLVRPSSFTRPERCPRPSQIRTAVKSETASVMPATWSIAAPPAGAAAAANVE